MIFYSYFSHRNVFLLHFLLSYRLFFHLSLLLRKYLELALYSHDFFLITSSMHSSLVAM